MTRAARLLDLVQILRRHRRPVTGAALADELGVSLRTLYRDVATLQAQGAPIDGEAGVGYVLRPGYLLPPLMFTEDEIAALVLGSQWVAENGDDDLSGAALDALAKIAAVLPPEIIATLDDTGLMVGPGKALPAAAIDVDLLRRAIRDERKLAIAYGDAAGDRTQRVIWPIALAYFDRVQVVVAWCELRDAFRHFRVDRIAVATLDDARYPRRRRALMKAWRASQGITR